MEPLLSECVLEYVVIAIIGNYDCQKLEQLDSTLRGSCDNLEFNVLFCEPQILCYIDEHKNVLEQAPAALKYFLKIQDIKGCFINLENELRNRLEEFKKLVSSDVFLLSSKEYNMPKYLACFDMDSCLISNECINEMGKEVGKQMEIQQITHKAMIEGLDFAWSLRKRLDLIRGLSKEGLDRCWQRIQLNPGALRLMHTLKNVLKIRTALISGGFTYYAYTVADKLGMDYAFSNVLEINDGEVTGDLIPVGSDHVQILDGWMKQAIMKTLSRDIYAPSCTNEIHTIAVGDGANDQLMVAAAGLGVAFHSKSSKLLASTHHHLETCSLDAIPFLLSNCPNQIYTEYISEELRFFDFSPSDAAKDRYLEYQKKFFGEILH